LKRSQAQQQKFCTCEKHKCFVEQEDARQR